MAYTHEQRQGTVSTLIEALENTDEITRLVAGLAIKHYNSIADPLDLFEKGSERGMFGYRHIYYMAPGMFMAFDEMFKACVETGEFIDLKKIRECVDTLNLKDTYNAQLTSAYSIVDYLFIQIAARNPNSQAERTVSDFGISNGTKMSRSFNTQYVIFHQSIAADFVESVIREDFPSHNHYDAVICLAALDDLDQAVLLMDRRTQKNKQWR